MYQRAHDLKRFLSADIPWKYLGDYPSTLPGSSPSILAEHSI